MKRFSRDDVRGVVEGFVVLLIIAALTWQGTI